jgi:hypothetical protein
MGTVWWASSEARWLRMRLATGVNWSGAVSRRGPCGTGWTWRASWTAGWLPKVLPLLT